jgi:hypothetical protein
MQGRRYRLYVSPKSLYRPTSIHGDMTQGSIVIFIALRTSNLTNLDLLVLRSLITNQAGQHTTNVVLLITCRRCLVYMITL